MALRRRTPRAHLHLFQDVPELGHAGSLRKERLVAELERAQVDIILAQGTAVSVINELPTKVPIAYVFSGDPVSAGLADRLSHPSAVSPVIQRTQRVVL